MIKYFIDKKLGQWYELQFPILLERERPPGITRPTLMTSSITGLCPQHKITEHKKNLCCRLEWQAFDSGRASDKLINLTSIFPMLLWNIKGTTRQTEIQMKTLYSQIIPKICLHDSTTAVMCCCPLRFHRLILWLKKRVAKLWGTFSHL